jgi:histidinol-phosphatase
VSATWGPGSSASLRRGSEPEIRGWLDLALEACDAADAVALRSFRRDVEVSRKPDRTYVSAADQEIERLVRERILARHPDHGLVGEDYGSEAGAGSVRWYVDPIDGTHNFIRRIPVFATLIAVERDGEVQAGVVSAPAIGSRWFAWRGGGAWSTSAGSDGPRRIHVSKVASAADAQLFYGDGPSIEASGAAPGFASLLGEMWRTRGFGDFWGYALVAEGAGEAMIEVGLSPWDVAAPMVLVEEAGGRLTDFAGGRSLTARDYLASNGELHEELLKRLRGAATKA